MVIRYDDSFRTRGNPGKIFVGGLPRKTTRAQFFKHFRKYGEIKDSVIMLDPRTGAPRGSGFVTYQNPSVIDKVMEDAHVINAKKLVIKRTRPKRVIRTKDFKTRRIFLTGVPSRLSEDDFKNWFKHFGDIEEYGIVEYDYGRVTNLFRGLGFITFDTEQAVEDLLGKGNKVELDGGSQILLHKVCARWEPPPRGFFKLNSDGSSAGNPGKAGSGGIIRNDQGQWILGYSRKLGHTTSICAELWGVRDGLRLAVKEGLLDVIIEVDSQVVLDLIREESVNPHTLAPIIQECMSLLEQIPNYRLCQINRESNSCADYLARMGAALTKDFVRFVFPPDGIKLLLFAESLKPEENGLTIGGETMEFSSLNHTKHKKSLLPTKCEANPGKIFVGGLARDTTSAQFFEHFGKYGEIVDSVIMKKKEPRGVGFVTFADPSVIDKVITDTHIVNGNQVEIKRTMSMGDRGTRRIFVGGIPSRVSEDEFKDFFSQFGMVSRHQITQNHATGGSCGFGYITFATEQAVDDLLANGNKVALAGAQVEIVRVEPRKHFPMAPLPEWPGDSRNAYDWFKDSYGGCVGERFDNLEHGSSDSGPHWGGNVGHAVYDDVEFTEYRGYGDTDMELYREGPSFKYSVHCGGGEFCHYPEHGPGMEPYRQTSSPQYSGHHRGEFGWFKCCGKCMEPLLEEPFLDEYSNHCERDEFDGGMELYRGEPAECLRHVEGRQFGEYGGDLELYVEEPFYEHPGHSRGGFRRGVGVEHDYDGPSEIYEEYHGVMEPLLEEPFLEYSNHCGRDEFGGGMELYGEEPAEHLRHVEGRQFDEYGDDMELYTEEPFHEQPGRSRNGFNRGYDVEHGYGGPPSEIYEEYGADALCRCYRGGAGGYFVGHRGGHGGGERGRWYHPYAT